MRHTESGEHFALKVMNKNVLRKKRMGASNLLQGVEHEIRVMKLLDHPNIIKLYEVSKRRRAPSPLRIYARTHTRARTRIHTHMRMHNNVADRICGRSSIAPTTTSSFCGWNTWREACAWLPTSRSVACMHHLHSKHTHTNSAGPGAVSCVRI